MDHKYIVKAQNELNETSDVRAKSLEDFRHWLARHDYFVDCRKGNHNADITNDLTDVIFRHETLRH